MTKSQKNNLEQSTRLHQIDSLANLPTWAPLGSLCEFLHEKMKPYQDTSQDVERGLRYALDPEQPGGGFAILASQAGQLVGAVVFVTTQMKGYIPENILLFVCVDPDMRGQGLGGRLIEQGLAACKGQIKLHVEPDNPAKRLYERLGFAKKYDELRHAGSQNK